LDIDHIEFNAVTRQPVAMMESKLGLVKNVDLSSYQFECLSNTAKLLNIPFFCLVYYPLKADFSILDANDPKEELTHMQYYIAPINLLAYGYITRPTKMTEKEYVIFLHKLRNIPMPTNLTLYDTWIDIKLPIIA